MNGNEYFPLMACVYESMMGFSIPSIGFIRVDFHSWDFNILHSVLQLSIHINGNEYFPLMACVYKTMMGFSIPSIGFIEFISIDGI